MHSSTRHTRCSKNVVCFFLTNAFLLLFMCVRVVHDVGRRRRKQIKIHTHRNIIIFDTVSLNNIVTRSAHNMTVV